MADESYLKLLEPHLAEAAGKGRPVVVMTCGIAGECRLSPVITPGLYGVGLYLYVGICHG